MVEESAANGEAMPTAAGTGDCFLAAFRYLVDVASEPTNQEKHVLVHGALHHLPQTEERNHAWVEEGNTVVHEVSNGSRRVYARSEYYAKYGVTNVRRFGLVEAMVQIVETNHYGPWP